jgi:hypothetical protein
VRTRRWAKSGHSATIDKVEHAFAVTAIYRYRINVSYPMKIFNHLRSPANMRHFMRIWKEQKTHIQMLALPFVSIILVCLHLPVP